ncbi:MAG: hypothetical protein KDE56_31955, partial [Anaerolineales bacterium]|nr:hypothetical protein [Anaerolineales bacterium]
GWRIIKRHILASWRGNNPHAGLMNLLQFTVGVGQSYYRREPVQPQSPDDDFAITRAATRGILSRCPDKVVHCRRQREIDRFRAQIRNLVIVHK